MSALTHSEQLNELAAALARAQGEMSHALKSADNPFFKSHYADLASVWDAVRAPLAKAGIAIVQSPCTDGSKTGVETLLIHASGQWIRGIVWATGKDEGPQAVGSCITYLRRYALQSFAGVAADDDDGNAAEAKGKAEKPKFAPKGFDEWADDLASVAESGTEALKKAWSDSKPEYRVHLTSTNPQGWESLKAIASRVKVAAE